uniref:Uncharacterized protein n=1 Tax=Globodera rostochiensis TaxID=31243 RepID=A0A914H7U4_GLORO
MDYSYGSSGTRGRGRGYGGRGFNLSGVEDQQNVQQQQSPQHIDFSVSRGRRSRYLQNPSENHPCRVEMTTAGAVSTPPARETPKELSTGTPRPTTAAVTFSGTDGKSQCTSCQQQEDVNNQLMAALLKDIGSALLNFAAKLEHRQPPK